MAELGLAELPRRAADLAILCEIGEALNSSIKLDETLSMVLIGVTAGQGLRFNRAFLLLVDERERCLRGSLAIGPDNPEEATRIWKELESRQLRLRELMLDFGHAAAGAGRLVTGIVKRLHVPLDDRDHVLIRCLEQGGPRIVTRGEEEDASGAEVARILGAERFALVPILSRSRPVGVLLADNAITGRTIEPGDLDILRLFASHAGTAIEKARLYEKVLEEKRELETAHVELRRNHQTILNLQRLSDLGEMSARVAHEIRNPLVTIGGFARRMLQGTGPDDPRHRPLEIIVSEVARLEKILIEVLDYARPLRLNLSSVRVNDVVRETIETLEPECEGLEIDLVTDLDDAIPLVRADAELMKIALLNLLRNALQAIPRERGRRGSIAVRTRRQDNSVEVMVEDNGSGVPPDLGDRIFDAFFTTKPSGSGLGLAIASQILKEHGGSIRWENKADTGAAFFLDMPLENANRRNG